MFFLALLISFRIINSVQSVFHYCCFENSPKDNDVQDSEDVAEKEEQHTLTEAEQALKDDLERMIAQEIAAKAIDDATRQAFEEEKKRAAQATSINKLNTGRPSVSTSNSPLVSTANTPYASAASTPTGANTGGSSFVYLGGQIPIDASTLPNADLPIDPNMPDLEDDSNVFPNDGIFSGAYDDEDVGAEADFNNMDNTIDVSPIPTLRVHKDHPKGQILGDPKSAVQTRGKIQKASSVQQALVSYIYNQNRTNHKDHQNCLLACFLSQEEPKTISQALKDESWVEAMQEELLQFKLQKVWILVDLPSGKKEEGIDYDEVFVPVARIEAIWLFLAFASFMGFPVYQMDVKSAFFMALLKRRRGTIDKTLFIKKNKSDIMLVQVYVDDIIFGSTTQYMCTEFEDCMHKRFQMSSIGELTFFLGLQVKQQPDGIFISQDKYVADILKKFDFCSIKIATTPIVPNKPLVKDENGVDVDVHVYKSMIGSLMYLTASRPNIMFVVCTCARFQVTPKASHLNAVKRIFSDYGGASLDRKSTTGGCQFLGRRLISWQCKKQTIAANSTTEAEYVAAANCCGLRATYDAELVSAASLVNTAKPTLSTARLGKFGAVRQIWCCQANLVLPGKFGAAREKFVLFVTVTTKTEGNSNFHEIVDFLASSSIHHALTVSPTIYTSYIEQFWNTASSQTVNDVKQINATVDSKAVVVTEASIRSSLLFNDVDGTTCLTNEAIFQNLALMGYEGDFNKLTFQKALFSPQWKFLIHTILHCLSSKSTSWNEFSTNIASAVICLATNQKFNFSKLIFDGDQPPKTSSSYATTQDSRDSLRELMGMKGIRALALESIKDAQATEISALKSRIKKLEKKCKPSISHHMGMGRKKSKPESTLDDNTVFDDRDHGMEYMETKEAVDEGRQSGKTEEVKLTDDTKVVEDKGSDDKGGNAKELISTARPEVSTTRPDIDAARQEESVVEPRTSPTTTSIFDDEDIIMAQTLIKMKGKKAKEKGVSIKDVDDSSRLERSILTLKPLPIIDPKYKDAEIARLVHENELAEMEREREERQRQDQASVDYIASLYDEVQAKMDASEELAARLQMEEREMYTIEERSKLLAEFFERRKKLLAEERAAAVRNKPPTRTQLRSLMMTYLKHTCKYRHNQLNKKTFEEIQALYIKEQERDADFMPIRSERDEKMIDKMNKKAAGMDEEEVPKSTKVEVKKEGHEENIRKRSGRRLKMKATKKSKRQKTDSDLEEEEQLRAYLKIVPDEEEEINYEVLGMRLDFIELHSLALQRFSTTTPEGIDLVLWGDLRTMFDANAKDELWQNQERWNLKSWYLCENCSVHTLILEDGTEIHMLAERKYPLTKETLERMLSLRLVAGTASEDAYTLLRFIQKHIDEFGNQDGSEKDL
ncbi:putative ribonuclease H-like domain-containing protein [Tanacetum coccineum]|uniref:Ribonuclease H-like domain-containing protein n=1 Tax=Tanacetum coccineum TaxID=301880 RepID=A0ABQ5AGF6_9ASTR